MSLAASRRIPPSGSRYSGNSECGPSMLDALATHTSASTLARMTFPQPLQRFGQCLLFHCAIGVPRVAGKNELVAVAPGGEHPGHVFVRDHPVVHVVSHHVRIEQIP